MEDRDAFLNIGKEICRNTDMEELRDFFEEILNQDLIQIVASGTKDAERASKAKVRPVTIRGRLLFQETLYRNAQVFHRNCEREEMLERLLEHMGGLFRQAQVTWGAGEATVLVGKRGSVSLRRRNRRPADCPGAGKETADMAHDRSRQYILQEGRPVDFMVELGVQTPDGKVIKSKYDKFRQINRYLEFIEDILDKLPGDRTLRIIDFGCGKSYLTFAMYYYLHELLQRDVRVTGLDLKGDVIRRCSLLAESLGYEKLDFQEGDISGFQEDGQVDMVVSLHACDKATDYALAKAVKWGASVIMAVPCCQHELNGQIRCQALGPILKYGLIKERMAALITDALRAGLLERSGYDTQILEFIDMEHTPKNLMIRAVRSRRMRPGGEKDSLDQVMELLQVDPTLKSLL